MKIEGIAISRNIVKKLLKKHKFVKRKILSKTRTGDFPERNEQFEIIQEKLRHYKDSNTPIISMDTKKKEPLGRLYRNGKVYCTKAQEAYDHNNDSVITGSIVPHGLYDIKKNKAYINIGTTNETAEFLCDSIKNWWENHGKICYPLANEIFILCDAGGANSWRIYVFKVELQKLSNLLNMKIIICHYPPYASKWNPIEHRVFPHVTRAMEGVMLESHEQTSKLIEKTSTKTGLQVVVDIIDKMYKLGLRTAKKALDSLNITYGEKIPGLNYSICPMNG
jgi:hypothetical protein